MDQRNDQDNLILKVISKKLVNFQEIILCLFENCNLSCVFCPQTHDSVVGMSGPEIFEKIPKAIEFIQQSSSQDFHIHVMGGELFQDKLIQKGFLNYYRKLVYDLRLAAGPSKNLQFNFVTNLIFEETNELQKFCHDLNIKLSVSYDPSGRFNEKNLSLFKKNVALLKNEIRMISVVLTRQNMDLVMAGDSYFAELYNQFPVDWDSLIPAVKLAPYLMPKESELLAFNKYMLTHYPECIQLESFTSDKRDTTMRCTRGKSLTIMPDGTVPKGCSGALFLKDSNTEDLHSNKIVENFINKYDCLTCEFYSRCTFTCFIKQDYKYLKHDIEGCVFKETFRFAEYLKNKKIQNEVPHGTNVEQ